MKAQIIEFHTQCQSCGGVNCQEPETCDQDEERGDS